MPGLVHRHQQVREPVVSLAALLGAAHDEAPVRPLRERRPHLLPVDDPLVALTARPGLHVRQVGAGVRLGVALAPELGARHDAGQEPLLDLGRGEVDQRRTEQPLADEPGTSRTAGLGVLLVERDLEVERQPTTAVLGRPADAGPADRRPAPAPRPSAPRRRRARRRARHGGGGARSHHVGGRPSSRGSPRGSRPRPARPATAPAPIGRLSPWSWRQGYRI